MSFAARLGDVARTVEAELSAELDHLAEGRTPATLLEATRYALLGGGKRFRPFLVMETARLFGGDASQPAAARVGAAFEALHAYSLVHDDLPAMDDDDMRRGRPTVHCAYDEATAILVGDGLQALAFALITSPPVAADQAGPLARLLAEASGLPGMVGGQYRDLNAVSLDRDGVALMQAMKTGALLTACCEAGAIVGGADATERARMVAFGDVLGRAFQLADDLLDVEGTVEETGKRVHKDEAGGKATLAQLLGPQEARVHLMAMVEEANAIVRPYGPAGEVLMEASHFVAERRS